jgi:hypothetical protein
VSQLCDFGNWDFAAGREGRGLAGDRHQGRLASTRDTPARSNASSVAFANLPASLHRAR